MVPSAGEAISATKSTVAPGGYHGEKGRTFTSTMQRIAKTIPATTCARMPPETRRRVGCVGWVKTAGF